MSDEFLFYEVDPLGYYVSLSSRQYSQHIIECSGHTDIKPEDICACVTSPCYIFKSTYPYAERVVYFSSSSTSHQERYIKTVTEFESKSTSQVVTAFPTNSVGGGIDTSEGGLLYCDPKYKL